MTDAKRDARSGRYVVLDSAFFSRQAKEAFQTFMAPASGAVRGVISSVSGGRLDGGQTLYQDAKGRLRSGKR